MRTLGLILIIVGIIGFIYGGISYVKDRHTADLGAVDIVVTEKEHITIPPVAGAIALVAGGVLVGLSGRKSRSL